MNDMRRTALTILLVLSRYPAFAQTYTTVTSVFSGGGGVQTIGTYTLANVIGQSIVGAGTVGSNTNGSGFLFQYGGSVGPPQHTGIFAVNVVSDTGEGSLRAALASANATPGLNIISFNIPGGGVHTIIPSSPLPQITEAVIIDGYTQPGASRNTNGPGLGTNAVLLIELNGINTGGSNGDACLKLVSSGSTIRGLVVNRAPGAGILLYYGGGGNVVEGNFVGTDAAGIAAMPNSYGVEIEGEDYDRIGGTIPASRNIISGNSVAGVAIGVGGIDGGEGHLVQGNLIGTNAAGTSPLGNSRGVSLSWNTNGVLIGGTTPGARNVISGNTITGVNIGAALGLANVSRNLVLGNFIGTDVTGTAGLGNAQDGVAIFSLNNRVGGETEPERNIISANGRNGVHIFAGDSCEVLGNYIGTDVTGTVPLGNREVGVYLTAHDVAVGGMNSGEGNIIAFNGTNASAHAGVGLVGANTRNPILGNSIFANVGLGIDLGSGSFLNGVTPNDPCDGDTLQPNNYQNYPVLTSATSGSGATIIEGTLNSNPNRLYRIEFFANAQPDSSEYGEGETFLGFADVATDGSCTASFIVTLPIVVPGGHSVSATATDVTGNTSEFSRRIAVGTTEVHQKDDEVPTVFALAQNYPNPFNPSTTFLFSVPRSSSVILKVYDLLGREVATLVNGHMEAGNHEITFDAGGLTSGVYFYRMQAAGFVDTKKFLLLK